MVPADALNRAVPFAETATSLRGRDLVVFSNDWDGDPLSKTHIMRILAAENRILWVNSIGNRSPRPTRHDVKRLWTKLAAAGGLHEVERNLFVLAPIALPFYGKRVWGLNRVLLGSQIRRAMRRLGFDRPISWSFLPSSAPVSGTLGEELVVYQCVDEFSAFSDTNARNILEVEAELLAKADLVITSAERLRASKARLNPHTVVVRHGVDVEHFQTACAPHTPIPADVVSLRHPIIGFYGLLADWIDQEAIAACARAFPQASVVVIGKVAPGVDTSVLRSLGNVHLLGRRPYSLLPGYCKAFDVALAPFHINELTLNANPLKVREYLAAGLPVVASDLPEIRRIGLCQIASSPAEFPAAVQACLAEPGASRLERSLRMRGESWQARVEEIRGHVAAALARKNK